MVNLAPPPTFDVQDLWFHITGFLHGRTRDLKNCALASRSLCLAAQSVLFPSSACRCLAEVLKTSPHLRNRIRDLTVKIQSDPNILIQLDLLCLQRISFHGSERNHEAFIVPLQNLIELPSVREVEISNYLSTRIFSGNISHLNCLSFLRVTQISHSTSALEPGVARPEIATLRLAHSFIVDDWLVGPSSPFDFARLVDFQITDRYSLSNDNIRILELLNTARMTITRLTLGLGGADLTSFKWDLSQFPALIDLHIIVVIGLELTDLLSRMRNSNGHMALRFLTLKVMYLTRLKEDFCHPYVKRLLRGVDKFLVTSLPVLEKVMILGETSGLNSPWTTEEFQTLFQTVFLALHARGLLKFETSVEDEF
ncbi:hypothetical protein B0H19DRAFT_1376314 [Mycena capillaripes]|nr:hypothetical protein B0H19DRAFT_1376314 [Mycena capillaripes]